MGVNGLSLAPDGTLYVNNEFKNQIFRLDHNADGTAGQLIELKLSQAILSPDGMRFGDDGTLYLAEDGLTVGGAGRVDAVTIVGNDATITSLTTTLDTPTSVTKVGGTLWVLESKLSALAKRTDPGKVYFQPLPLK